MFKSIMVCTDGSSYSETASEYGIHLAKKVGARLIGLHVMDARLLEGPLMADISGWIGASPYAAQLPQFRELLREKAEAIGEAFATACQEAGIAPEVTVRTGHPISVILEESAKVELTVLGQKGEHAEFLGEMMGSTAERISRHIRRPCLLTPAGFRPIRKILAAYDGSAQAGAALELAAELAAALAVPLTILTIAQKDDGEAARAAAANGVRMARDHGAEADSVTMAVGRAGPAILQAAEERNCDLIALGSIGHSRFREFFIGSAAAHVAARSSRPVLMVR